MTLNSIKREIEDIRRYVEVHHNPNRGLDALGYWFNRWKDAYHSGDEEALEAEVDELLIEDPENGILKFIKLLCQSPKE